MAITIKHRTKVLTFFNKFVVGAQRGGRILVRDLQRMLGLQIWIRTVFRVTRWFLTSMCDAMREALGGQLQRHKRYFYPRKHRKLVTRILFDLKFYWRFVLSVPETCFDFLLARLPRNGCKIFCNASSLFGMSGVLVFDEGEERVESIDGLF